MMLGENRLFCSYDSVALLWNTEISFVWRKGKRWGRSRKTAKYEKCVFFFPKKLLDQMFSRETQILEDGIQGRYIGQSGKCPRNVNVKLDPGISRGIMWQIREGPRTNRPVVQGSIWSQASWESRMFRQGYWDRNSLWSPGIISLVLGTGQLGCNKNIF